MSYPRDHSFPSPVSWKLTLKFQERSPENSQAGQWLGLYTFTDVAQVKSLVGELRSCKPRSMTKKEKPHTHTQNALQIQIFQTTCDESQVFSFQVNTFIK